jgi:hypothetical protein
VINEVDETLRAVVKGEILSGTDVDVVFDAPTRDWASRRNKPTLNMYLYDIREDLRRRETGFIEKRNDRGIVEERRQLPRFFKLAYLITAWTQRPEDEHRLLAAALALFMRYDYLPAEYMTAVLQETEAPLLVQIAYPPPEDRQVSDVWTSLGGDLKPSIDLIITMPIQPEAFLEVARAVMAPMRLHSTSQKTIDADDGYRQLAAAPSEPVAPEPAAPPAGARPRRGNAPSKK